MDTEECVINRVHASMHVSTVVCNHVSQYVTIVCVHTAHSYLLYLYSVTVFAWSSGLEPSMREKNLPLSQICPRHPTLQVRMHALLCVHVSVA